MVFIDDETLSRRSQCISSMDEQLLCFDGHRSQERQITKSKESLLGSQYTKIAKVNMLTFPRSDLI